jgi:hypothetical protein
VVVVMMMMMMQFFSSVLHFASIETPNDSDGNAGTPVRPSDTRQLCFRQASD